MGLVQGGWSELMYGGGFETAFLGTFAGSALGAIGVKVKDQVFQTVKAAVIGGTVSEIGGGKFANGAAYAAFSYAVSTAAQTNSGNGDGGGEWIFPEGRSTDLNDYNSVMTNGILGDRAEFALLVNESGIPGYFNPSKGFVGDIFESIGQRLNGANDQLAAGFARGLANVDHPMTIIAHSQGTLTVANAARHFGVPSGSTFVLKSPALSFGSASAAVASNGGVLIYNQRWGDAANLWAPSINPVKFASGVGDVFCGFCVHRANGLP